MLSVQEESGDRSFYCWAINNFPLRRLLYSRKKNDSIFYLLFPYPVAGDDKYLLRRAIVRAKTWKNIAHSRHSIHVGVGGGWVLKYALLCLAVVLEKRGEMFLDPRGNQKRPVLFLAQQNWPCLGSCRNRITTGVPMASYWCLSMSISGYVWGGEGWCLPNGHINSRSQANLRHEAKLGSSPYNVRNFFAFLESL